MTIETIRVFKVETDFIAAENEKSAIDYYVEMIGEPERREEIESETDEISRDRWPNMKIVDIDEVGHPERTFQAAIENMLTWDNQEYPKTLASTEY